MPNDNPVVDDIDAQVKRVTAAVVRRTGTALQPEVIEQAVRDGFATFAAARVRDFVPVFVERRARDHVRSHILG